MGRTWPRRVAAAPPAGICGPEALSKLIGYTGRCAMADRIRRVDYCYVEVPDRPGEGARVLGGLQEQGVSLLSMTAFPTSGGKSQIDLVAASGDLENAAQKAGLKLSAKKRSLFVTVADLPCAVVAIFLKLAVSLMNVASVIAAC